MVRRGGGGNQSSKELLEEVKEIKGEGRYDR